jgi:uncharacterized repeat protein (TIGR01451 family)
LFVNALLDPQKLFSYSWSFDVTPAPSVLPKFNISIPQADLAVTLVSEPPAEIDYSILNPNPQANYTVTVTNNGPLDATNVVLTDLLPAQIRFGSVVPALATSVVNQGAAQEVVVTIGNLPSGQSENVTIEGVVNPTTGGTVTSSFGVSADQRDLDLSNNALNRSTQLVGPTIYLVSTETDLRNDISLVNNAVSPAFSPIIFLNPVVPINLTLGELNITQSVTITTNNGARALINAGGLSRVFDFTGNNQQAYRLENVSLENGNGGADGYGGAISAGHGGSLTIVNSAIITSTALTGGGVGGAIYAAAGTLNLVNDDFENNQANAGGALNLAGEITTITNTNISNNSATGKGSAIDQFSTSNTFSLAHVYPSGGSFTTTVRVVDLAGHSETSSIAVTVVNIAPTAQFVLAPSKFPKKGAAIFKGAGSDPGPGDNLQYAWTVTIPVKANKKKHLKATTKVVSRGSGQNFSFSTKTKGTYTVTLTVTDNQGATGMASRIIKR